MPETVIKIPGLTQIFTIDEREKTVAVISRNWRKVVSQHKFEAERLVPEYCEKNGSRFPAFSVDTGVVGRCARTRAVRRGLVFCG